MSVKMTCLEMLIKNRWLKGFYMYLIDEGVVNKFTGKIFGGVSWKVHMKDVRYKLKPTMFLKVKQGACLYFYCEQMI